MNSVLPLQRNYVPFCCIAPHSVYPTPTANVHLALKIGKHTERSFYASIATFHTSTSSPQPAFQI